MSYRSLKRQLAFSLFIRSVVVEDRLIYEIFDIKDCFKIINHFIKYGFNGVRKYCEKKVKIIWIGLKFDRVEWSKRVCAIMASFLAEYNFKEYAVNNHVRLNSSPKVDSIYSWVSNKLILDDLRLIITGGIKNIYRRTTKLYVIQKLRKSLCAFADKERNEWLKTIRCFLSQSSEKAPRRIKFRKDAI